MGGGGDEAGIGAHSLCPPQAPELQRKKPGFKALIQHALCFLTCNLQISRLECKTVLGLGNSYLSGLFHAVLLALGLRVMCVIRGWVTIGRQVVEWAGVLFGHGVGSNIFILPKAQEMV